MITFKEYKQELSEANGPAYLGDGTGARQYDPSRNEMLGKSPLTNADIKKFENLFSKLVKKYSDQQTKDTSVDAGQYGSAKLFAAKSGKIELAKNLRVHGGQYGFDRDFAVAVKIGLGVPNAKNIADEIMAAGRKEMLKMMKARGVEHRFDNKHGTSFDFGYASGAVGNFVLTQSTSGTNYYVVGVYHSTTGNRWK